MLVPMARMELIGPKNRFFDVVSLLHEIGHAAHRGSLKEDQCR